MKHYIIPGDSETACEIPTKSDVEVTDNAHMVSCKDCLAGLMRSWFGYYVNADAEVE